MDLISEKSGKLLFQRRVRFSVTPSSLISEAKKIRDDDKPLAFL
jgi:hypothetical protein